MREIGPYYYPSKDEIIVEIGGKRLTVNKKELKKAFYSKSDFNVFVQRTMNAICCNPYPNRKTRRANK